MATFSPSPRKAFPAMRRGTPSAVAKSGPSAKGPSMLITDPSQETVFDCARRCLDHLAFPFLDEAVHHLAQRRLTYCEMRGGASASSGHFTSSDARLEQQPRLIHSSNHVASHSLGPRPLVVRFAGAGKEEIRKHPPHAALPCALWAGVVVVDGLAASDIAIRVAQAYAPLVACAREEVTWELAGIGERRAGSMRAGRAGGCIPRPVMHVGRTALGHYPHYLSCLQARSMRRAACCETYAGRVMRAGARAQAGAHAGGPVDVLAE